MRLSPTDFSLKRYPTGQQHPTRPVVVTGRKGRQRQQGTTVLACSPFRRWNYASRVPTVTYTQSTDPDDLELLDTTEGIEFYKDGENVVISSESICSGEDGVRITYDSLVNAVVELRDHIEKVSDRTLPRSSRRPRGSYQVRRGYNGITIENGWGRYDIDAVVVE